MKHGFEEDPPHSRIFILHSRDTKEEDLENAFNKFGHVEHIWRVKDKNTGENKGVSYIKYSKFSEAAMAVEEMNGICISGQTRPLKVIIASSREKNEEYEKEKFLRLFILLPKDDSVSEEEIQEHFGRFGKVEYVSILKDRATNKSKGFAYVKYNRIDEAATALEECDRKYKPVLARPRSKPDDNVYDRSEKDHYAGPSGPVGIKRGPARDAREANGTYYGSTGSVKLSAYVSTRLTEEQAYRLFDLMPGLLFAELVNEVSYRTNHILLEYNSPDTAEYAVSKLNGFEYPIGEPIMIKRDFDDYAAKRDRPLMKAPLGKRRHAEPEVDLTTKLAAVSSALVEATKLIAGGSVDPSSLEDNCSVSLPPPKPILKDGEGKFRLFFVCKPKAAPLHVLKDVFCRFGNMASCYLLPGRNCGYISYCVEDSANKARLKMHDQELYGSILKVVEADPPTAPKRPRYET